MKLAEKISWLMGRVQRSLFPHLNECLPAPLTEQEKRLVSIIKIVQVERYVPEGRHLVSVLYPYFNELPHNTNRSTLDSCP